MAKARVGVDVVEAAKLHKPEAAKVEAAKVEAAKVEAPKAAGPAPVIKQWRVLETKQISLHGHVTKLRKGDVISEASYGEGIEERLRDAKIKVESC